MVYYLLNNTVGMRCAKLVSNALYSQSDDEQEVRETTMEAAMMPSAADIHSTKGLNY